MDVSLNTCNSSEEFDTFLHILDVPENGENSTEVAACDDYTPVGLRAVSRVPCPTVRMEAPPHAPACLTEAAVSSTILVY